MKNEIVKYIKDRKGNKIGVLVGIKTTDGFVGIGWSKYATSIEYTPFSKEKGLKIARGRAFSHHENCHSELPFVISDELGSFIDRCQRYFKDCTM